MSDDDPITKREFDAGIAAITDRLDTMNGSIAENSRFRVQSKAVYGVIAFAWVSILIPLTAIAVAVLG
ncbi:hypothetical protein LCGC14_2226760 [marine sediment metagenome]|uniref:Uncharacterized protein n=1 Tax=marine sediment metagenome TaxID=412755 RepID=A0A0F9D9E7_9ZZZZ